VWYSAELEFPVKILQRTPSGDITMEYRNIEVGAVPDAMFEIPPGYQRLAIPGMGGEMPSGMPQIPTDE
jgi:hypothetical protein